MRLLVVQSNTSQFITDLIAEEAGRAASPDTEIRTVTVGFGARGIECRTEVAIAAHATVAAFAENADGVDAGVISCFSDPGLAAARELMPFPVVGIAEASMLTACMLGGRFSIVTLGARMAQPLRELAAHYGLASRLASVRTIERRVVAAGANPGDVADEVVAQSETAIAQDGAEVIILGGGAVAGLGRLLADRIEVPLLDGVTCAVRMAEALYGIGASRPRTGSYRAPAAKELVGVSDALSAAFK
ncbi:aspartate/glutamate racemase family protein [Pseudaminobacter sp. NGMCC 1.201702]|uniref:aspartate/glutamate racemase family protein n=1 Tax=Pseudaminobacter sp. NGMCC 1.201702 TaxID=3391825 RepID=UPI0039F03292